MRPRTGHPKLMWLSRSIWSVAALVILLGPTVSYAQFDHVPSWAKVITWKGKRVRVAKGQIILKFKKGIPKAARGPRLAQLRVSPLQYLKLIDAHVVQVSGGESLEAALKRLAAAPALKWAEPNFVVEASVFPSPNDPYYQGVPTPQQFYHEQTEIDRAWNDPNNVVGSKGGVSQVIAVLDSGIEYDHGDFNFGGTDSRILTSPDGLGPALGSGFIVGVDYINGDNDPMDDHWHGTHVAGIAGAATDNATGIAGTTWFPKLMPVKVLGSDGTGTSGAVIDGLTFAKDNGASVVNLSLRSLSPSSAELLAIQVLDAAGIVQVAATGNDAAAVGFPAGYPETIAVGSVDATDAWSTFSNFGPEVTVVAPGESIVSLYIDGGYAYGSGTSAATPQVAGLAAALLAQNPDWAPETVRRRLIQTTDKPAPPGGAAYDLNGHEDHLGYGRIQAYQALGGVNTTAYYTASVYLYGSKTALPNSAGANPATRHVFADSTGGMVTFSVQVANPSGVVIASAEVRIQNSDGSQTVLTLSPTVLSSTLMVYSASTGVSGNLSLLSEESYVPEAALTDTNGVTTRIPLPAYTVPAVTPCEPIWIAKNSMPTPRYRLAAGVVNSKLYAIGGSDATTLLTVEEYDPATGTWTAKNPMPTARNRLAAGVVNGKIYAIGGSISTVEEYDPATDTWTTKKNMPTARADLAVEAVNGKLYAIGGWNGSYLSTVEEYDPATDAWVTKTPMLTPRIWHAVGVVNGKIYAIGGWNGSSLSTVEEYDPATDTWATKASMPTARERLVVGVVNGKLYAIGGFNGSSYLSTVERYDPATDEWLPSVGMPTGRRGAAAGVVNGRIYVIGGYNGSALPTLEEGRFVLESALAVSPSPATVGQWVEVVLTVANTGTSDVTEVVPGLQINSGASLVSLEAGPEPAGPLVIAGGAAQAFTWTFGVSGSGEVTWTASADGKETGCPILSQASADLRIPEAVLELTVVSSTSYDFGFILGGSAIVSATTFDIVNSGSVAATLALSVSNTGGGWIPVQSGSPGFNEFELDAQFNFPASPASWTSADHALRTAPPGPDVSGSTRFAGNETGVSVPVGQVRHLWIRLLAPSSTNQIGRQRLVVTLDAQTP